MAGLPGNARSDQGRSSATTDASSRSRRHASNLVPGDSNERSDVFLRDRAAKRRSASASAPATCSSVATSSQAQLSGDGSVVSFFTLFPQRSPNYGDCVRIEYAPSCTTTVFNRAVA